MVARDYFNSVRDSAKIIVEYDLEIEREMSLATIKAKSTETRHPKGTPTDSMYHVDKALDMQAVRVETLKSARQEVEKARVICAHVSSMLGDKYGKILQMRYIELMTWPKIAQAFNVTRTHAQKMADIAIDWVDCEGLARIKEGTSRWTNAI